MSGFQQQTFRTGYEAPSTSQAAQPRSRTTAYNPTAAVVQPNRGLAGIGEALGGFFRSAEHAVQTVAETEHREQLVQIERENKALETQGATDQGMGREVNPAYADRQAYVGAYTASAADAHADQLTEALRQRFKTLSLDGSEDPEAVALDLFKTEVGKGTGDAQFDGRVLYSFKRRADQMLYQKREEISRTVEANAWETVRTDVARQMTSQQGITGGQMADLRARILTMSKGDQVIADKHIEAILGEAIQNDGQARSALNALQEIGYAQANPDSYLRLSDAAFKRTNQIKTFQAGEEVQQWQMDFQAAQVAAKAQGRYLTPDEILGFTRRAHTIDSKHGVGAATFMGQLGHAWDQAVKDQAGINLVTAAYFGEVDGVRDGGILAARFGEDHGKLMSKYFDPGVASIVARLHQSSGGTAFAELAKTAQGGLLNPLASGQAAQEFASLVGSTQMLNAAPGGLSDTYKTMMGNAINGTDPVRAASAYRFFKAYEDINGPELTDRLFANNEARTVYAAAKGDAQAGRLVEDFFKRRQDTPQDTKDLAAEAGGQFDWRTLTGKPDAKPWEVQADVVKRLTGGLREAVGRDAWFGKPDMVFGSSKDEQMALILVSQHLRTQARSGGSLDLSKAVAAALPHIRDNFVALPGQGKSMVLVSDPFAGRGRQLDHPIATHNGQAVYAPFKMKNRLGEFEDPVQTFREDLGALQAKLPGVFTTRDGQEVSADKYFLMRPNEVSGLHPIVKPTGEPVTLQPGKKTSVRRRVTKQTPTGVGAPDAFYELDEVQEVTTPTDQKEFEAFLKENLPPGVFPVVTWTGPQGQIAYGLSYGFRVKGDAAHARKVLEEREAEFNRRMFERTEDATRPVQFQTTPLRNYRRSPRHD